MQFPPVGCAGLPGNKIAFTLSQADAMSSSKEERMISDSPVSISKNNLWFVAEAAKVDQALYSVMRLFVLVTL